MIKSVLLTVLLIYCGMVAVGHHSLKPVGYRTIIIVPIDPPPNGYHLGDTVRATVQTRWPGGTATPLPNYSFMTNVFRPDGTKYGGQWHWRTDANGNREISCVLLPGQLTGSWYLSVFLTTALPDGSWDGDSWTFQVVP